MQRASILRWKILNLSAYQHATYLCYKTNEDGVNMFNGAYNGIQLMSYSKP